MLAMADFDDVKGADDGDEGQVAYDGGEDDEDKSESDFSDSEDDLGDSDTVSYWCRPKCRVSAGEAARCWAASHAPHALHALHALRPVSCR